MDLGMYPEAKTGGSLLGLLPFLSLQPTLPGWGRTQLGKDGLCFSKQRVFQNPPTVHGLSPTRSQVLGATRAVVLLLACIDLPDLGAHFDVF